MTDHPTYEIRAITDFAKVPADRLDACLAEFRTYLQIIGPTIRLLDTLTAAKIGQGMVTWRDTGVFCWIDDGEQNVGVRLRDAKGETIATVNLRGDDA